VITPLLRYSGYYYIPLRDTFYIRYGIHYTFTYIRLPRYQLFVAALPTTTIHTRTPLGSRCYTVTLRLYHVGHVTLRCYCYLYGYTTRCRLLRYVRCPTRCRYRSLHLRYLRALFRHALTPVTRYTHIHRIYLFCC